MLTRPITTTLALAMLALTGLLGACGGDDGSDDAGPASIDEDAAGSSDDSNGEGSGGGAPDEEAQDAALEYAECMREHGIDMPDPEISEGGIGINLPGDAGTPEEIEAAEAECRPILDEAEGDRPPIDPEELAERQDQAVAVAECMRDRGHDFPDPEVDEGGGIAYENPPGMGPGNPEYEQFEDDMEACEEEVGMSLPTEGEGELSEVPEG